MDKKVKRREYKDTPRPMGIFQIRNKANGKHLIGSSKNLGAILNRYKAELRTGTCRNDKLQEDWRKYGADQFEFSELEVLKPLDDPNYDPDEDLRVLEALWLEKLAPYGDRGYNKESSRK